MASTLPHALKAICDFWGRAVESARKSREPFMAVAQQCHQFYAGPVRFMWESDFKAKYIGNGIGSAKFEVTMNKAFEFVTMFGPSLFWQYPQRTITPLRPLEFPAEVFGDPSDPQVQQMHQQMTLEAQQEWAVRRLTSDMMERYLNYTPAEQTGTLAYHGQMAVTEALIKGRGVLWPEPYQFPGSDRTLTQLTWDTVDHLFIDGDCRCPLLSTAKFVIRRHINAIWDVERRFNLPPGTLNGKGHIESSYSSLDNDIGMNAARKGSGEANDLIVWYEVFSKAGVGTRMRQDRKGRGALAVEMGPWHAAFEEVVGDFAYVCFAPGYDVPLNAPAELFADADDDAIREAFAWPYPSYVDGRWPMAVLDFHPNTNSAWPIAPLAPALGPLICINVLTSAIVEQAWENRKTIVAYVKSAASTVEKVLKSADTLEYMELSDALGKSINECVQILQRPAMNGDILQALAVMTEIFEKNSNLNDFTYGATTTQSRSAADIAAKQERTSVRPAKMAQDVKSWMTVAANLEKLLAAYSIKGSDVEPLLGRVGAQLWDQFIASADPELIARSMTATCEAEDMARPNREKDFSNLSNLSGWLLPTLEQYAAVTGDTNPLNSFLMAIGDSMNQDVRDWMLGPWSPAPPPEDQLQLQQQMQQLEVAGKEAEVAKGQVEAEKAAAELMGSGGVPPEAVAHESKLLQSGELFAQKMAQNELEFREKMRQQQIMASMIASSRIKQRDMSDRRKSSGMGSRRT